MKKLLIPMIVVAIAILFWYIANFVKTFHCDFEAPYKCEAIRIGGIVFPPVGVIVGYINIWK